MKTTILIGKDYGKPEVLDFVSQELPPLQAGYARIQVNAAGINPIDARRMTGEFKFAPVPQTFGTEYAGVILELADDAKSWSVGEEVLGSGDAFTHATIIDVPLVNLVRRPANVPWAVAGSIAGAAQTAMTVLDELGDISSLLVHGASGGVGSILVQLARERSIDVVATASERNQEYLRGLGANPVVYGSGLTQRLQDVHPELFDASVDMVGTEEATEASLATVRPDGFIGTIAGKKVSSDRVKPMWVKRNRKNLEYVVKGIADGSLKWEVEKEFPFKQARDAYASILEGHTRGKSVLTF